MQDNRPPIPAEIRRKVLVEAGHRCAIPTCRYIEIDVHHIIPWEACKKHEYENLIALCPNCHRRADRGEIDRKSLRIYKANLRFAHDKFSQFEIDILFELYNRPIGHFLLFQPSLWLLIVRVLDAEYAVFDKDPRSFGLLLDTQAENDLLRMTQKGRQFIESLRLEMNE